MTVSVIAAPIIRRSGNIAQQAATLSTASASLSVSVDLVKLVSGTATVYYDVLPTSTGGDFPAEGQHIMIVATGTGLHSVWISGTATGRLEMESGKFIKAEYWGGHWWVTQSSATISTAS